MRLGPIAIIGKKALARMEHGNYSNLFGAFFNRSSRDYTLSDPTSSSLLMAVVRWITRRYPEAPLYLERKTREAKGEPIREHAMLDLLEHPNSYYSGVALFDAVIGSFCLDGNGYIVKIRGRRLDVTELWYVPHTIMEPMVRDGSGNFIDYYRYTPAGKEILLDPEDVIHFRNGIDPNNPRKGYAPLKSVIRDASTDEEADNFSASMLRNMGVPGIIVSPDLAAGQTISEPDVAEVKKYVEQNFTGDKRGRAMVLRGPTKVEQFGFDPKAMDLSAMRNVAEERVCAVMGVPAAVVGFGTGLEQTTVGATIKTLREMAYEDAIIPLQRILASEIARQLLPDFEPAPETWKLAYDLSEVRVLQDDQDALYKRTIDAWNGGLINRAQAKQAIGFEAMPSDNIRRVPFSTTEIEDGQPLEVLEQLPSAQKSRRVQIKGRREGRFAALQLRAATRHTAVYIPELADGFVAVADRVVAAYEAIAETEQLSARAPDARKADGDPEPIDPNSPEGVQLSAQAAKIKAAADAAGPLSDELSWKAHYYAVTKTTVANIEAVFGISFDLPDMMQREILAKGGRHFALVGIDKQTQDGIFKGLLDARSAGKGVRETARLIRANVEGSGMYPGIYQEAYDRAIARGWSEEKAIGAGDKAARQYRAEVISRTETKFAQNVSTLEVAKGSGTFNAIMVTDGVYGEPRSGEIDIASNGQIISFESAQLVIDDEHPSGTLSLCPVIAEPNEIEEPLLGR